MKYRATMATAFLPLFLGGCAMNANTRALSSIYAAHRDNVVKKYTPENIDEAIQVASADVEALNDLLNDLILLVDINYYSIEKNLVGKKSWMDFSSSAAVIGLNSVASLYSVESVKNILIQVSGGIEGTHAAFNRDIMADQSMLAVINTMRKLRADRLLNLRTQMAEGIRAYPLRQGLTDIAAYYNAGTFTVALQEIVSSTGEAKENAEDELSKAIKNIDEL